MNTTTQAQDAAAHRELRARGVSEERIAQLDAGQLEHRAAQQREALGDATDVAVGWCSEHARYFRWNKRACAPGNQPTRAEIRAHYDRQTGRTTS